MRYKTISQYRLTSDGKFSPSADSNGNTKPILIAALDISSGVFPEGGTTAGNWHQYDSFGSVTTIVDGGGFKYLHCQYDDSRTGDGTCEPHVQYYLPSLMSEVYVEFYARKTAGGGSKFLKMHGQNISGNYANATFAMDYASGALGSLSYGDGSSISNDAQCRVDAFVDGDNSGRSGSLTRTFVKGGSWNASDWGDGTQWHNFRMHLKQNSGTTAGNEVNDGIIEMWIDGVQRVAGYNIFNRHYSNTGLEFLDFLELSNSPSPPFNLDMHSIKISRGGWMT
jgi:hypothetical protein